MNSNPNVSLMFQQEKKMMLQIKFDLISQAFVLYSDARYAVCVHSTYTQLLIQHSQVVHSLCVMPKVGVHQVRYQMDSVACSHVRPSERHTLLPFSSY